MLVLALHQKLAVLVAPGPLASQFSCLRALVLKTGAQDLSILIRSGEEGCAITPPGRQKRTDRRNMAARQMERDRERESLGQTDKWKNKCIPEEDKWTITRRGCVQREDREWVDAALKTERPQRDRWTDRILTDTIAGGRLR